MAQDKYCEQQRLQTLKGKTCEKGQIKSANRSADIQGANKKLALV